MLETGTAQSAPCQLPLGLKLPRERRNRAQMKQSAPSTKDWPGPREYPVGEPPASEVEQHAKWKADKLRFEMNVVAAVLFHDESKTEAEVNVELFRRFRKRLAQGSVWKLAERCKELNPHTGRVNGFFACIPRYRPTRLGKAEEKSNNPAHKLSQLFRQHPSIEAKLVKYVFKRTTDTAEMRPVTSLSPEKVWDTFLGLCKAEGMHLSPKRWPFTHGKRGYEAIRAWYHGKKYERPSVAAFNELDESTAKAVRSAYNAVGVPKVAAQLSMAYARVEGDEHKFDAEFTIFVPGETPDHWVAVPQGRIYVIAFVECETGAVLSADIAVNRDFTTEDVMACVHDAVVPPPPPKSLRIEDPEWQLAEGAAFLGEVAEFKGNTWQVWAVDRALQHRAQQFRQAVRTVIGGELDFDTPDAPLARNVIESFFKRLAAFAKRLESATGNRPDSPERKDSAKGAVRSRLTLPFARELLQVFCRNYNATKLKGKGRSPIELALDRLEQDRCYISRVGTHGYSNMHLFLPRRVANLSRRVGRNHGPICVYLGYEYYVGPALSSMQELMTGPTLVVDVYVERDARFAIVIPRDFPEYCFPVVVAGMWATEPHPLEWRMKVKALAAAGWFEDHADKPLLGLGVARGLARAAQTDEGLAQLLTGYFSFVDLYGNDEVPYFAVDAKQRAELLTWLGAEDAAVAARLAELQAKPAPKRKAPAAPPAEADMPAPSPPASAADPDDEYGIL